ncbi:alpha/beta fold hydrolase [Rubrivivax rivuli]|uniref:Alpha/beta fold hydrolase n=1 Tax=Rubrivivax rivuli TaxID=1862385 RepID=A0A437R958_9BURK|nr:alpha/beta fold hydrolase [Rubrivivax rivuli]RVU43326.1 alpha/beta fold hydrolase [Rubrivivax rivuli]
MTRCFDLALPHGITLACRAEGRLGAPRVMLLHGFPEAAFVWDEVMALLADRADCLAPNLRGFEGSSAPTEVAAYKARPLVADIAAAIETTGGPLDLLVAHDWGGALAWNLAAAHPGLMKRLLIVNSPHPATFLRELRHNAEQQAASAYMNFLCRPDAARLLAERDYARLWPFFGDAAWLTPALRDRYRQAWHNGGRGLEGALNYYRASPLRPATGPDDALYTLVLPDTVVTVPVPTTVLWGEGDVALRPGLLDGLDSWVPQLQLLREPGATHWVVHERPGRVAEVIAGLL